jgi:hypothetical protein
MTQLVTHANRLHVGRLLGPGCHRLRLQGSEACLDDHVARLELGKDAGADPGWVRGPEEDQAQHKPGNKTYGQATTNGNEAGVRGPTEVRQHEVEADSWDGDQGG